MVKTLDELLRNSQKQSDEWMKEQKKRKSKTKVKVAKKNKISERYAESATAIRGVDVEVQYLLLQTRKVQTVNYTQLIG